MEVDIHDVMICDDENASTTATEMEVLKSTTRSGGVTALPRAKSVPLLVGLLFTSLASRPATTHICASHAVQNLSAR